MGLSYLILFFLIGLLFFWPGMAVLRNGLKGRKWPSTKARITHSRVDKKMYRWRGSNWTENLPDVRYKYSVDGIEYSGEQAHFGKYKKKKLEEIVRQYPIGKGIDIRYHPHKHHLSLIRPLPVSFHAYFFIGVGICLWISGILFLLII